MSDNSKIEWTDGTLMTDRNGKRIRIYHRENTERPGQQHRREMAAAGKKWCRSCAEWLPSEEIDKNGLCRPHANEAYRQYYETKGKESISHRVHARKRGILPVPVVAREYLLDQFEGFCGYCRDRTATTWDHVIPVAKGGKTVPGNVVPACNQCNSSKKDSDAWEWSEKKGLSFPHEVLDVAILMEVI